MCSSPTTKGAYTGAGKGVLQSSKECVRGHFVAGQPGVVGLGLGVVGLGVVS